MKFKVKKSSPNQQKDPPLWPADAEFEYNNFGEKIMVYPRSESFVKDVRGVIRLKSECEPYRRDQAGRYYYVHVSDQDKIDELDVMETTGDMKPSVWEDRPQI